MLDHYWTAVKCIFVLMTLLWIVSIYMKDVSIIDLFWGPGFVLLAWIFAAHSQDFSVIGAVPLFCITVWGMRLGIYLSVRRTGQEDPRYQAMRAEHPESFWYRSYVTVFLLQGALILILSLPLYYSINATHFAPLVNSVGVILFAVGLYFEAMADYQLMSFKSNPDNRGKLLTTGLWQMTRHPNYFGDAVVWWGFFLMALSHPSQVWLIYAPVLMTFFLMRVSGVSLLEKSLKKSKAGYEEYMRVTPAFFPKWTYGDTKK